MAAVAHPLPPSGTRTRPRLVAVPTGPAPVRGRDSKYRRRRLIAIVLVASAVVAAYLGVRGVLDSWAVDPAVQVSREGGSDVANSGRPSAGAGGGEGAGASHVVQPGDTLWSIAEDLAAGRDVRVVVDVLAEANGSAELQVGEAVQIPAELLP